VALKPRPAVAIAAALALAAASLALPFHPVYDPWAWLIWGRELVHGGFETAAGPSWKPLPVLLDAPLSLLGDAAPQGWLLVARSGWLSAALLAGLLAARLSGEEAGRWRWAAAAVAAGSVALTADSFTPPLRQFTGGLSEPLLVALVLGAVWAALDERPGRALGLGATAALLRPEVWPFLALWAYLASRERPRLRLAAIAVALLIPLAWFVPDIVGAGNPLEGGETARAGGLEPLDGVDVLWRALAAPLAACWIGLALLLWQGAFVNRWFAKAPRAVADRPLAILLAGAGAWVLLVAVMAIAGFAGLPRFLAPATAIVAVAGAVGIARAAGDHRSLALLALALALAGFAWRAAQVPGDVEVVERQTRSLDHLFDLVEQAGGAELLACQDRVRMAHVREQPALAWKLEEPIRVVLIRHRPRYGVAVSTRPVPGGDVFAHSGRWRATRLPCPTRSRYSPTSASGRAIAGVSGAAR